MHDHECPTGHDMPHACIRKDNGTHRTSHWRMTRQSRCLPRSLFFMEVVITMQGFIDILLECRLDQFRLLTLACF